MVTPIQSGQSSEFPSGESKAQQQKIDQLQWEINLISTYVTVTEQNSTYGNQIDSLKKDLNSGTSPEKLVPNINQLIQQLNQGTSSDRALPSFELTSSGNEKTAMENYVSSVEKVLKAAAEKGVISKISLSNFINQTSALADKIRNNPSGEALNELNQIIRAANQTIPPSYQLKTLGNK